MELITFELNMKETKQKGTLSQKYERGGNLGIRIT
jgi:hypothetical protein